ncbi:MAG: glycosylhydrolase-like jelly roll fold domain-containing protein, partial [Segetibacter sp.]
IILPANKFISEKSFHKLVDLARNGAHVLVYKNLPVDVPGFAKLNARRMAFQKLVGQLKFTNNGRVKKAVIGKGSFLLAEDLNDLLVAGGVRKETLAENGLQFTRRKNTDGYTSFINNRGDKEVNKWVTINEKAASAALFDAMSGAKGLASFRTNASGNTEVKLQLKPFQSIIVQLYNTKKTGYSYPYINPIAKSENLHGNWTVTFVNGGPSLPTAYTTNTLNSWTERDGDAYKYFSGTAKYSTQFTKPTVQAGGWKLDLGKVNETAEVLLNGKRIATLIGPDYTVIIPDTSLTKTNTLEVMVSNLMANRIIYMDKNNIEWKKFYNTNMPARRRENSKNGLFDASAWDPLPSGLIGPVTLTPVSFDEKKM